MGTGDLTRIKRHPVAPLFLAAVFVKDGLHEFVVAESRDSAIHQVNQRPPIAVFGVVG